MVDELTRLRAHVADLQFGMYVNCVYCGHRHGPGETTPVSMADALKAHVETYAEHPMSKLRAERDDLAAKLAELEDCGQDGVCALSPGCVRHWRERNSEIAAKLVDVEAQCAAMRSALADAIWSLSNRAGRNDAIVNCEAALAANAGQALLARVKWLEIDAAPAAKEK